MLDDTKRIQHNAVSVRAWVWHCSTECICMQSTVPDHILQYLSTAEFTQGEESSPHTYDGRGSHWFGV